jgi:hypothetical protein
MKATKASPVPERTEATLTKQPPPDPWSYFQYIGRSRLSVMGKETRRLYRFDRPGAISAVDNRDQRSLERVATLRRVKILFE